MTDRLIFVHDKRRDAYVDKTSEIVGLRPAGAYVYVDYGAARVFRYRKEHVVCYPLLATRRQVRIYKDGTLQEPYDTLFDYGTYVRLGAGEGLRSPAIEKSRIEAVDAQPLAADKERPKPLWSRRPIRRPQRRVPKGRRKVRSPPCSPRRCSASIRRIPVRRCMPI